MRNRYVRNFVLYGFIVAMLFPLISFAVYAIGNMGATDGIPRPIVGTAFVDADYHITATPGSIVGDYCEFLGDASASTVGQPVFRFSYDFLHGTLGASSTVSVILALCVMYQLLLMAVFIVISVLTLPISLLSKVG